MTILYGRERTEQVGEKKLGWASSMRRKENREGAKAQK